MENKIFNTLLNNYISVNYAHSYIMGFSYSDMVYMTIVTDSALCDLARLDKASRGQGYALRYRPSKAQKQAIVDHSDAVVVCSKKDFDNMVKNSKYNKGEIFEKLVTEKFGQEWHKDNTRFTESGDIMVNKVSYQIKYERGTFVNEKFFEKYDQHRA